MSDPTNTPQFLPTGDRPAAATALKRRWDELDPNHDPKPLDKTELAVWNRRRALIRAGNRLAQAKRDEAAAVGALADHRLVRHKRAFAALATEARRAGVEIEDILEMVRLAGATSGGVKGLLSHLRRSGGNPAVVASSPAGRSCTTA